MELTLYRCAYELVNNAMKHAQAKHIDIQLMQTDGEVTLTVSDDGKGIGNNGGGMGLQNIRERIEPYRGALRIVSNEHDGTEINVTLPL
jgi:signal transduction histidine kinase